MESVLSTVNEKGVGEERGRGHCPVVVFPLFSKKKSVRNFSSSIFDTVTVLCQNNGFCIYRSQDQTQKIGSIIQKVDI